MISNGVNVKSKLNDCGRLIFLMLVAFLLFFQTAIGKNQLTPESSFGITPRTTIFYGQRQAPRQIETSLKPLAEVLSSELELVTGFKLPVKPSSDNSSVNKGDIFLRFTSSKGEFAKNETLEDHSFTLTTSPQGAVITSAYYKGVSLGTVFLIQALEEVNGKFFAPALDIEDKPASAFRGLMIDVARTKHSIPILKDMVRLARQNRLRYLQLHLTDHQAFTFPFEPVITALEGNNYYFTRQELKDLVAYADTRGITIIPEIDMPGHTGKLLKSGYLPGAKSDADVADLKHFDLLTAIIDDSLEVFASSPYFHVGGDESSAGSKLVPFLKKVNDHLRNKPEGQKKRLIVWEGFYGSPTDQLPPTGDDRVIVMVWDHNYNTPWNLLQAGYQIINSSWKPCYLVGPMQPFQGMYTGGRKEKFKVLHAWDKDKFMNHSPGTPVFEDKGPNDPDKDDGFWDASYIGAQDQIIGSQMCFWEQYEQILLRRLPKRLAIFGDKLWNPDVEKDFDKYMVDMKKRYERIMTIAQPIEVVVPEGIDDQTDPIVDFYYHVDGDQIEIKLRNRTKIDGEIRYEIKEVHGKPSRDFGFNFPDAPTSSSPEYTKPITSLKGLSVRAVLFKDGRQIEGTAWEKFCNWGNVVRYTEYDIGRRIPDENSVIDLSKLPADKIKKVFELPMIRQPVQDIEVKGQMIEGVFIPPASGTFTFQTRCANVYIDFNENGKWEPQEIIFKDTPFARKRSDSKPYELKKGKRYHYRIDRTLKVGQGTFYMLVTGPGIDKVYSKKWDDLANYSVLPPKRDAYKPTWESLSKHNEAPEWFRDAKFGIYFTWGVFSVPAHGYEWYPRWMYFKGTGINKHHLERYGDPTEFGYHDFVPMFKAEHFDAEQWCDLFERAGARFVGPLAEHHDGYAMWDSDWTPWNVMDTGPKRDITGELEKAIKKRGMKFITTFHHARHNYWQIKPGRWTGHYAGIKEHYPEIKLDDKQALLYGYMPREKFLEMWKGKLIEIVDKYQPDMMWFDSWLDEIPEDVQTEYLAYYFNKAKSWGRDVVVSSKLQDFPHSVSVEDYEKGRTDCLTEYAWLTDDTLSFGSWSYTNNLKIKESKRVIHTLVDIVSKNGQLLLNISPKADGTIPADQRKALLEIGQWLGVNGEAIYGTRPWKDFGEGPTRLKKGGHGHYVEQLDYTSKDIRFTRSKDSKNFYATCLGWPEEGVTLESVTVNNVASGANVSLLGSDGSVSFKVNDKKITIEVPDLDESKRPCKSAYCFKLTGFDLALDPSTVLPALTLTPEKALLVGTQKLHSFEDGPQCIGYWSRPEDKNHWLVKIPYAGHYSLQGNFAAKAGQTQLSLTVNNQQKTFKVPQTGDWQNPAKVNIGTFKFDKPGVYHLELGYETWELLKSVNVFDIEFFQFIK